MIQNRGIIEQMILKPKRITGKFIWYHISKCYINLGSRCPSPTQPPIPSPNPIAMPLDVSKMSKLWNRECGFYDSPCFQSCQHVLNPRTKTSRYMLKWPHYSLLWVDIEIISLVIFIALWKNLVFKMLNSSTYGKMSIYLWWDHWRHMIFLRSWFFYFIYSYQDYSHYSN